MQAKLNPACGSYTAEVELLAQSETLENSASVSLDQRMAAALSQEIESVAQSRLKLRHLMQSGDLSDPSKLFEFQEKFAEEHIRINFLSALTKKGVDVFTNLLRG